MIFRSTLFLLLLTFPLFAQPKRPMAPEDVVGLNRASDAQLAPDARRVAFVVTAWEREADRFNSDIWLTSESREPAVRITSDPQRDDHPRWSPNAQRIAFLSERESGDANRNGSGAQIWVLNARGGEPVQLTHHQTPVLDFEWSPDGRFIAFIASGAHEQPNPKPPRVSGGPAVVDEDDNLAQLWLLDVTSGRARQLTTGAHHVTALNWSLTSQQLVFTARATPRVRDVATTEIFLISVSDSVIDIAAPRAVTHGGGAKTEPRVSPDGRWVSYLARTSGGAGPERIHLIAAEQKLGMKATAESPRAPRRRF